VNTLASILRFPSVGRVPWLADKFVGDTAALPLATRPRRCSASAAMPENGQLPAYRRWVHRLLGIDSDLPTAVIKLRPVHRTKNELEVNRVNALARDDHPKCPVIHPANVERSIVGRFVDKPA
jgi:hypothetical protein